jgi:hypothetical protein
MERKLSLRLETLSVESFETAAGREEGRGTVRAHQEDGPEADGCTCRASCVCPSAYYWCGDGYETLYSCDYTRNASCAYA